MFKGSLFAPFTCFGYYKWAIFNIHIYTEYIFGSINDDFASRGEGEEALNPYIFSDSHGQLVEPVGYNKKCF